MSVLALALLPVLLLPVVYDLSPGAQEALNVASLILWAAFVVEYVLLLSLAPDRKRHVRTHLPDLVLIAVPMLRPLRALRVLRVFGVGASLAVSATKGGASVARQGLLWTIGVVLVLLGSLSAVVLDLERDAPNGNIHSYGDAVWWAITTSTTVGYGDRFPTTGAGRAVGVVVMLCGIAVLGVVTAAVAAWFVKADEQDPEAELVAEVRALRDEIAALRVAVTTVVRP
jgi:voltage-gated potassium channel